jgi:cytochrome c oxidase subunit III
MSTHVRAERGGPPEIDVSGLPPYAFGSRSILWWATFGLLLIETVTLALIVAAYYYLRGREQDWPPGILGPPALVWGTLNTVLLLASVVPNQILKKAAERLDLRAVRPLILVMSAVSVLALIVRVLEFGTLNCDWATTAYGSVVYAILGLHTAHLLTDGLDTYVLAALMFSREVEAKRFVDVAENADYWYFVVLVWLPVYATLYWAARWV